MSIPNFPAEMQPQGSVEMLQISRQGGHSRLCPRVPAVPASKVIKVTEQRERKGGLDIYSRVVSVGQSNDSDEILRDT